MTHFNEFPTCRAEVLHQSIESSETPATLDPPTRKSVKGEGPSSSWTGLTDLQVML